MESPVNATDFDVAAAVGQRNLAEFVWGAGDRDGVALIEHSTGRTYRHRELIFAARRFAAALVQRGLHPGANVAVICPNGAEFIAAYYGSLLVGGVVLALDPLGATDEWEAALTRTPAGFAVVTGAVWHMLARERLAERFEHVVVIDDDGTVPAQRTADAVGWDAMLAEATTTVPAAVGGDHAATLIASSGTQGEPKQIVLTHRNIAANLVQIDLAHRLTAQDVVLGLTPFRHVYGMLHPLNSTLRVRATVVTVATPFTAADLLDTIQRRRITVAYLVPSVLAELARFPDVERYDTSSVRLVYSGGAPLPLEVAATCARILGAPVVQGYGMTEACCTYAPPDIDPGPAGSIGLPVPGTQTRFVDPDTGLDVDEADPGEIWIRGPQVSPGFVQGDGEIVPVTDEDGWLHTGDIGRRDARGYVTITGRAKQLIKYKGHQVAPAELEAILLGHPNVADAVVVGVPDEIAGEIPVAYVVLSADVPLDDVSAYVAERVAPYKKIRRIEALTTIPRSAMGKPLRGSLGH